MRELLRHPWSDEEMFERGWQLSILAGFTSLAVGYELDSYQGEWTLQVLLGPVRVVFQRMRPCAS